MLVRPRLFSGNGFEINFIPDYKILHDAGYHVLAYDLRNHGLSGAANGGITTGGVFEARDIVGSLAYARTRPDTRDATTGLFSRCMGASSTLAAMTQFPDADRNCWFSANRTPLVEGYVSESMDGRQVAPLGAHRDTL